MLEAETRYLPLHSELGTSPLKPFNLGTNNNNRPVNAPPDGRQQTTFAEVFAAKQEEKRPDTADGNGGQNNNNQAYESSNKHYQNQQNVYNIQQQYQHHAGYDNIDVQQQSNTRYSNSQGQNKRMAANFLPAKSESRPQEHMKKRSVSPVTKAQEFLSESDMDSVVEDTQSSLELKLLKALIASRQNRKSARKSVQDGASNYSQDISSSPYR